MYANFELYSGGLVTADVKRKRVRTTTGCLPCRKRKKKCDESWPVCGSCRKRYSCDNCYRDTLGDHSVRALSASPLPRRRSSLDSDDSLAPDQGASTRRSSTGNCDSFSVDDGAIEIIPRSPFTSVADVGLPSCSLPALFHVFDPASHGNIQPESSITTLTIPLTARSPAVFHAMTACSSIFLAQTQPAWQNIAIQHHCEAVKHLAREIDGQRLSDAENLLSCLAVVMMLHLFEKFDSSSPTTSYMHISAAQELFLPYLSRPPTSCLGALVLEAYIYHVALNSTFHAESLKSYGHLDTLTRTLTTSVPFQHESTRSYRRNLWLELPPELLACIYKISYLRRHTSSTADAWSDAAALSTTLDHLASMDEGSLSLQSSQYGSIIRDTRQLYIASTRLLLSKLMNPTLRAVDADAQTLLTAALRNQTLHHSTSPLLWYPLTVLGTAAASEHDRELITSRMLDIEEVSGHRSVGAALRFLATTWSTEDLKSTQDNISCFSETDQLDVWLDDSLLGTVGI